MIKTYGDRQPGLGTSAIVGALTLAKTGTTARTATFPDAAITVAGSASALTSGRVPFATTGGLLTDSPTLTFSAHTLGLGDGTSTPTLGVLGAAGTNRTIAGYTGSFANSARRWLFYLGNSDAESGANAGSNVSLLARDDAGNGIDTVFKILRVAGGNFEIYRPILSTGAITVPNGTAAAPGIRLTSEASGLYRVSATSLGFAVAGTAAASLTSGGAFAVTSLTVSGLTSGRVPFATTGGLLTDSADFTWTGSIFTMNGGAATSQCSISADSGFSAGFALRTAGSGRWTIQKTSAAESGSDAGSNWSLTAFTDAGTTIDQPISIVRASGGAITLARPVTCTGAVTVPNGTAAAPGIRLTSEASGWYRASATSMGASIAGVAAYRLWHDATNGAELQFNQGTNLSAGIFSGASTGFIYISGSTGTSSGGQARLYGNTHATKPSYVEFTRGATVSAYFDNSGILTVNNTTDATTTSDGSVRMSGGLSVAKNIVTGQSALFTATTAAGTTAGQLQRETNQDKMYSYANAIGGWLDKCIFSQYASVTQSGIVTDQSLASATARGTRTLPANFFKQGKVLKFRLCGRYTTDAAAGNATIQIKLGTTVFRTSGSFALDNSVTNLPWELEGEIICLTTGASGTVEGISLWKHMITGATGNYDAEALAGTTSVTLDTTASQTFDVVWTADDAGTAITCTCFRLWEVC